MTDPDPAATDLNSEHGEAVLEECARIIHGLFAAESRPPLSDCVKIAQAVIEHAAPFLASDARAEGVAAARADERQRIRPALEDALEGLREMLPYCGDYFRGKWQLDAYVERAEKALADLDGETP